MPERSPPLFALLGIILIFFCGLAFYVILSHGYTYTRYGEGFICPHGPSTAHQ